jgi:hypothetical protein
MYSHIRRKHISYVFVKKEIEVFNIREDEDKVLF